MIDKARQTRLLRLFYVIWLCSASLMWWSCCVWTACVLDEWNAFNSVAACLLRRGERDRRRLRDSQRVLWRWWDGLTHIWPECRRLSTVVIA